MTEAEIRALFTEQEHAEWRAHIEKIIKEREEQE